MIIFGTLIDLSDMKRNLKSIKKKFGDKYAVHLWYNHPIVDMMVVQCDNILLSVRPFNINDEILSCAYGMLWYHYKIKIGNFFFLYLS